MGEAGVALEVVVCIVAVAGAGTADPSISSKISGGQEESLTVLKVRVGVCQERI